MKFRMIIPLMMMFVIVAANAQPHKGCTGTCKNAPDKGQCKMVQPTMDKPMQGAGCKEMIPDLTEEQKQKMETMHMDLMKAMKPLKNQMMEKEAQLNTLRTADKPDMNKIFALVDDISTLNAQMTKEHEKHIQAVRQILNEKQRLQFDMKCGHGCGMGHGGPGAPGCHGGPGGN